MKITYNNITLSEADNLQDLTLNLISAKINFFLNKPEFKVNTLIPNTLRSYNELVSCFKGEDSLDRFENYLKYRISSEFDNNKVEIFNRLINSNDEYLFILLLNYLSNFINKNPYYDQDYSEIEGYVFFSKNPYNISISDLVLSFNHVDESLGINDYSNKKFLDFLSIYTSLRILKCDDILKNNLLYGGLVNDHYIIFPKQLKDGFRRDQLIFNYKPVIDQNPGHEIWLNYFITSMGALKADYRLDDENIYERRRLTRVYETAYFSPIFPLVSVLCLNKKLNNETNLHNESSDLINKCIVWSKENEKIKDLFCNPLFVNEFNRKLDNYTKHNVKESLGKYSQIIHDYIFKGIPYVVNELKQKYTFLAFLDSNKLTSNPIYDLWMNNPEEYSKIIDDIYSNNQLHSYAEETIIIAQNALNKYEKYFDKSNKSSSQQGTKQAMNFLVKLFEKDKDVHKELNKYRSQMDRQYNIGLNNIHNLLNRIANG